MSARFDVVDWAKALPMARARREKLLERQPIVAVRVRDLDASLRQWQLREVLLSRQIEALIACVPLALAVLWLPLCDRVGWLVFWAVVGLAGLSWLIAVGVSMRRTWRAIQELEDQVP